MTDFSASERCAWTHEGLQCLRTIHPDDIHSYESEPGVVAFIRESKGLTWLPTN